jgi:hypothetical protein
MGRGIENRLQALEESTPSGYTTFDTEGKPVIQAHLPALEWMQWATKLLQSRGRDAEKAELRRQLARSTGADAGGGHMYQLVSALCVGPVESER